MAKAPKKAEKKMSFEKTATPAVVRVSSDAKSVTKDAKIVELEAEVNRLKAELTKAGISVSPTPTSAPVVGGVIGGQGVPQKQ